jgi:hypothetical protein
VGGHEPARGELAVEEDVDLEAGLLAIEPGDECFVRELDVEDEGLGLVVGSGVV